MSEYEYEVQMPQNSVYRDILSLIDEHSKTLPDTPNAILLQELIDQEIFLVKATVEGSLLLIKSELAEIKKNNKVQSTTLTSIK